MKRLIIAATVAAMFGVWNVHADEANALTSNKIEAGATLQIPN